MKKRLDIKWFYSSFAGIEKPGGILYTRAHWWSWLLPGPVPMPEDESIIFDLDIYQWISSKNGPIPYSSPKSIYLFEQLLAWRCKTKHEARFNH